MMVQRSEDDETSRRCYALCVGIGTYSNLSNHNLRYAVADATVIADRLADPQRGDFAVTVLNEPTQTTKAALDEAVTQVLSAPGRRSEDLALLYFSCHGDIDPIDHTFCLLPSNASLQTNGQYDPTTLLGIADFAQWFAHATVQNIVVLLDVCHSGGVGKAIQHFEVPLDAGPNIFFIGGARLDQAARQSSQFQHGLFTHCLLRAFEQPPTANGWLTVSQIHTFLSDELPWFTREHPTQVQSWSVAVTPNLPLIRNPGYPELAPLPPVWNVPWSRNIYFTGQEVLLSQLAHLLQQEQRTALTQPYAISGLGGIGKTQLAIEYAYRHRQDYHAILWGRADTADALISTFVTIAHLLDLPQKDEVDQMAVVEAVKTWLRDRPQWLLILDNADDLTLVQEFLPSAFRGHLLLTTRAQTMGKVVRSKLEVEVMLPEIGALLLLRRARIADTEALLEEIPDKDVAQAKRLAEELGGLPLALDQAGAYIEETQCGLTDYWQMYQMQRAELLARRGGLLSDDHPESVATTWSLSFAKVEEANPLAAEVLHICAFLAPDAIPEELIVQALKIPLLAGDASALEQGKEDGVFTRIKLQLDEAVALLRAYSLLSRDPSTRTLTIHRLVQAILFQNLSSESLIWMQRVLSAVIAAYRAQDVAPQFGDERLLPHALLCAAWIERESVVTDEASLLLSQAGNYLYEVGRYAEAEPLTVQHVAICEQRRGSQHPDTANALNNLAELYRQQKKYAQAESLFEQALAIYEQIQPQPFKAAGLLSNLGTLYYEQGKYTQAEPLLERSLAMYEQIGSQDRLVTRILNNLGKLYDDQEKYAQAESLLQRALIICEQQWGTQHPETALVLNNLALLYLHQKKYSQAEPLFERALAIRKQSLGAEHPQMAHSLGNLALLYYAQEKYAQAEPLFEQALAICELQLGVHPDTAVSLSRLAYFHESQGKYAQANPLYERALMIYEQQLGPLHPDTISTLVDLANLYEKLEKYDQAEAAYLRVRAAREQIFGAFHIDVANSLFKLAVLYLRRKSIEEAEPLLRRSLEIYSQQLGAKHPQTIDCLDSLVTLYLTQGEYAQAEPLCLQALAIRKEVFGERHPHTAICLNNLATVYSAQTRYAEAESLLMQALAIPGQKLHHIRASFENLATVYEEQEKYEEAEELYIRILDVLEQHLGEMHIDVANHLYKLVVLFLKQGKISEVADFLAQAVIIYEKELGLEHPLTIEARKSLASILTIMFGSPQMAYITPQGVIDFTIQPPSENP